MAQHSDRLRRRPVVNRGSIHATQPLHFMQYIRRRHINAKGAKIHQSAGVGVQGQGFTLVEPGERAVEVAVREWQAGGLVDGDHAEPEGEVGDHRVRSTDCVKAAAEPDDLFEAGDVHC